MVYVDYSEEYRKAMLLALNNPVIGEKFKHHLDLLNQQGL